MCFVCWLLFSLVVLFVGRWARLSCPGVFCPFCWERTRKEREEDKREKKIREKRRKGQCSTLGTLGSLGEAADFLLIFGFRFCCLPRFETGGRAATPSGEI